MLLPHNNTCPGTHLDPIIEIQKKCVLDITFSYYLEPNKDLNILAFKKLSIQRIMLLEVACLYRAKKVHSFKSLRGGGLI